MKALPSIVLITLMALAAQLRAGEKSPTDADVRQAIVRSLPFVEKDGLAWIKRRDCMSCHTVMFMIWAHNEAAAHGVPVDAKKVQEWTKWSRQKSLAARVFFKLDQKTLQALPEPLPAKLGKMLDEGFTHEKDLVAALAKHLTAEELQAHQAMIVKKAAAAKKVEGNDGGGLDTMAQLLLSRTKADQDAHADFYRSTAELIVRMQEPKGNWRAGGQLPSRRWARPTADQTTTLWTILALESYNEATPAIKKSLAKAHASVKAPAGDGNLEWIVARLLYEQKFGTPDQCNQRKQELLKRQNADGGWSVLTNAPSDAFSTGQSLYALRVAGLGHDDPVIRRGQQYLLTTQNPDGSWTVSPALTSQGNEARHKKLVPIWRNWSSSWATIGLAKSLPER